MRKNLMSLMIAILLAAGTANAQMQTITGVVTNLTDGSPIHGVSVMVKNTQRVTVTDIKGVYTIAMHRHESTLVFTFPGMQTQEIIPGNRNSVNVTMAPAMVYLEEDVIYGGLYETGPMQYNLTGQKPVRSSDRFKSSTYIKVDHDFNTESYSTIRETGFKDVLHNPLSTFSIDVDNAAYSNIRRFINNGQLPPQDAVRVEEMLNYFNYNYPEPTGRHPFSVYTELSQCPWNPASQLLHVGLKGRNMDKRELPTSNLVFLIDISGSMSSANRLPLAKTAMKMLVEELRPQDRVSIVVYASRTEVLLESTPAREKGKIIDAIEGLRAGGYTAGGQALRLAYEVATNNFIEGGNNRIIMATDGDFNVGESSTAAMERLVEEKRKQGVFITVLGFGMGNYKDDRLETIANKGNGNYAYIDNIQEARKVMVSEFAGTLFTIAKDVKLQIEFNPERVKAYRLIGYENRRLNNEDFNDDTKDAGEMGAGHSVTALYEIIPAGTGFPVPGVDPLKYQPNREPVRINNAAEMLTIKARYKKPDGNESILFDQVVRGRLIPIANTTDDFRFASSVAAFGLLLLNSPYKADASFESILNLATGARGKDENGYRAEFINLVRTAQNLERLSQNK